MPKPITEILADLKRDADRWKAFQEWWDEDWSWEGLPEKLRREAIGVKDLQEYWRDQEDRLVEFAGRRWTLAHLPPCDREGEVVYSDWFAAKSDDFWNAIHQRLPDVSLPIIDVILVDQITPRPATFYGVVFPGWPKDQFQEIVSANFKQSMFIGWCSFSYTKFAHSTFDEARFLGDGAYFDGAEFFGGAHFSFTKLLAGTITFSDTKFHGGAYFRKSVLRWPSFLDAVFEDGCDFADMVLVNSGCYFNGTQFGGGYAHFDRVVFNGVADFSFAKFDSVASFTDSEFKFDVYFRCDKGGKFAAAADFNGANLIYAGEKYVGVS